MSVSDKGKSPDSLLPAGKDKRRFLSPEKKYQIFLEAQRGEALWGRSEAISLFELRECHAV